jgi:hypothetical protein
MKKILIFGILLFSATLFAGAQQSYAWSTVEGGCLTCHTNFAGGSGTGHSTHSAASVGCTSCHTTPGSTPISSGKCIVCHPQGNPGQCNLVNTTPHAAANCLTCHTSCAPAVCIDNDNDTYGVNCPAGPDCDDNDNTTHAACCVDNDGDGYGDNCTLGPDCNDNDNTTHDNCEINCTLTVTPKRFSPIRALLQPFQFFAIRADRNSDISFSNPICIFWESEGIDDVIKIRIGEKLIIGYVRVWASHLTAGDFKVYVTFGDTDETQCGPITVNGSGANSFIQPNMVKLQSKCGK